MKKKWCLVAGLFLCVVLGSAQDTLTRKYKVYYYPSGIKSSEGFLIDGKPDGWWKSYDEKGNLISEGNRKDFLLDSLWTFYADGHKSLTIYYKAGKKNGFQTQYAIDEFTVSNWLNDTISGIVTTYDTAGWIKKCVPYLDGKPHGLAKEIDVSGLVTAVTPYWHGIAGRRERINRTDASGAKQGGWKYFWNNGNLRLEGSYLNGKRHGFFKYYDENGAFLHVEKYDHDQLVKDAAETKKVELHTAYHTNGKPSIVASYYNGRQDGIRREFDTAGNVVKGYLFEDGWLRYEGITDFNGLRQGLWKEYYQTGELRSKGKYKNSNPIGEWKFYFQDMTIEIVGIYGRKGRKQGEWIWFYPGGDTMTVANYDEGELDGRFVEYDENGMALTEGYYVAGLEEGLWVYRNGNAEEKGKYDGGKQDGVWKTVLDNGKTIMEISYRDGLRHGRYTAYWENGRVKKTGKYVDGLQDGVWMQYDEEGVLFLTTLFQDGKEIKWNNYTIK